MTVNWGRRTLRTQAGEAESRRPGREEVAWFSGLIPGQAAGLKAEWWAVPTSATLGLLPRRPFNKGSQSTVRSDMLSCSFCRVRVIQILDQSILK